ncbi:hypothetical protein M2150_001052 [Lachnospiraceae bacterium PM6-15]|uniref:DUF3795 domain-containing protein n=1 Tax=Ohessyouella blattaphilus TaxID=2949333 RepID=UPI003E182480
MDKKTILNSIAYCGLICALCHETKNCYGCKSDNNCCGRKASENDCFQYNCCTAKRIEGCWECDFAPCDYDMFSEDHDIRNRTFVKVAKAEDVDKLAEYVAHNQENGIIYGWNKDYDNLGSEQPVIDMLHKSKKRG